MSLTAANSVVILAVPPLFGATQLQGFATDDIYDIPQIRSVETLMGVDGVLSGGFVYEKVVQQIMLQADSASNAIFDLWWGQMQAAQDTYEASGNITLPSIATRFTQTKGFLTGYKPAPAGKKILQPRSYEITWERIFPSPA